MVIFFGDWIGFKRGHGLKRDVMGWTVGWSGTSILKILIYIKLLSKVMIAAFWKKHDVISVLHLPNFAGTAVRFSFWNPTFRGDSRGDHTWAVTAWKKPPCWLSQEIILWNSREFGAKICIYDIIYIYEDIVDK